MVPLNGDYRCPPTRPASRLQGLQEIGQGGFAHGGWLGCWHGGLGFWAERLEEDRRD